MRCTVCQSYRETARAGWIDACLASVTAWTQGLGWDYRFVGDEILDYVPATYRAKAAGRWPVLTDYGRLALLDETLKGGVQAAVWLDADVLVFDPSALHMPADVSHAFGRELWVQQDKGRWAVRRNVHNAVVLMRSGNPVLDFYAHAAARIVTRHEGGFPDQVVGPKLLGALHNLVDFPLIETVGVLSPAVVRDVAQGAGPALDALRAKLTVPLAAVNLCCSMIGKDWGGVVLDDATMQAAVDRLLDHPALLSP